MAKVLEFAKGLFVHDYRGRCVPSSMAAHGRLSEHNCFASPTSTFSVAVSCNLANAKFGTRRITRLADILLASEMKGPIPAAGAEGTQAGEKGRTFLLPPISSRATQRQLSCRVKRIICNSYVSGRCEREADSQ